MDPTVTNYSPNPAHLATWSLEPSIDARPQTAYTSKFPADIAANEKKTAAMSAGPSAIPLRQPVNGEIMSAFSLLTDIDLLLKGETFIESLALASKSGAGNDGKTKGFDVANLKINDAAALYAVIQQALLKNKTTEREQLASMVLVKEQMTEGVADNLRAIGQAALTGAIVQAVVSLTISAIGYNQQQKGIKDERALLNNDQTTLIEQKNALNVAKFSDAKGGDTPLNVAAMGRPPRLDTAEGSSNSVRQNNTGVQPRHEAEIKEAAEAKLERQIGFTERDLNDKRLKAENAKIKGVLISQMANPVTGIVGGNTQVMQANENAQQHLHQQAGHVADSLADTSNVSARDIETLIQYLLQTMVNTIRLQLDTAGMIAGKHV